MKLKELEKRLKQEPGNLGLRVQVAGMMRESGRSLEAVELYRSVALAYRDQGRTQQAIAVCRSILEIAPEDAACQGLLSMLQQRATPAPTRPPTAVPAAPAASAAPAPPAMTLSMRGSPLPPAPEVPSLRPPTSPASRAPTKPPPVRPTAPERPLSRTTPPVAPSQLRPTDPGRHPEPGRRSSMDMTPLPNPVPYHVHDRTSQPSKISSGDLERDIDTRPDASGLAGAARRISGLITDTRGIPDEMDLAAELDTRQRRRIEHAELEKIEGPPPTVPVGRYDPLDDLDIDTRPPGEDSVTDRHDALTPPPRGSDDALTGPQRVQSSPSYRNLPRIAPPSGKTPSRPPAVVSIPPKTSSRPPGSLSATSSRPPASVSVPPRTPAGPSRPPPRSAGPSQPPPRSPARPSQAPPSAAQGSRPPRGPASPSQPPRVPPPVRALTPPGGSSLGRLRPMGQPGPAVRPAMPKIPRDSDDELTQPKQPRDRDSDE